MTSRESPQLEGGVGEGVWGGGAGQPALVRGITSMRVDLCQGSPRNPRGFIYICDFCLCFFAAVIPLDDRDIKVR